MKGTDYADIGLIATLCLCLCSEKLAADERATVLNSDNVKGSPPFQSQDRLLLIPEMSIPNSKVFLMKVYVAAVIGMQAV